MKNAVLMLALLCSALACSAAGGVPVNDAGELVPSRGGVLMPDAQVTVSEDAQALDVLAVVAVDAVSVVDARPTVSDVAPAVDARAAVDLATDIKLGPCKRALNENDTPCEAPFTCYLSRNTAEACLVGALLVVADCGQCCARELDYRAYLIAAGGVRVGPVLCGGAQ